MSTPSSYLVRAALIGALTSGLFACTRPPPDPPGVGEQPRMYPERNPATLPTSEPERNAIPAAESPDDPDSLGTTRTPPAAPALPMDDRDEPTGPTEAQLEPR